jgi:hypothetical protein
MIDPNIPTLSHQDTRKSELNKRLEDIGWALFLVVIGCLLLVPANQIPPGIGLIVIGLIMLGVNAVRYLNSIKMSTFSIILGGLALTAGLAEFFGIKLPLFAIFLILMGISILLKSLMATSRK